jgi:hypothetical protein
VDLITGRERNLPRPAARVGFGPCGLYALDRAKPAALLSARALLSRCGPWQVDGIFRVD